MSLKQRFIRFMVDKVRPFTKSPRTQFATAIILIMTGLFDVFDTVAEEFMGWSIGAHHGMIVFGTIQGLYALTEILDGIEGLELHEVERQVEEVEEQFEREEATVQREQAEVERLEQEVEELERGKE